MTTISTQLGDIIEPVVFSQYIVANSAESTAFSRSGVLVPNGVISEQLQAGADSFSVPNWFDLGSTEADIASDDPDTTAAARKLSSGKQVVRKSFLHGGWSVMNLASELSGSDALARIQNRVAAYWGRQLQRRLVASLSGILSDNIANDSSDMVLDIHGATNADITTSTVFNATSFIDCAATLGDALNNLSAIAMHSSTYSQALKNNLIEFLPNSQGEPIRTYRGLMVIVDDGLPYTPAGGALSTDTAPKYTTVLFGTGAVGYGLTPPRINSPFATGAGTEIESKPGAGNGGGMQILHSRVNLAVHPAGFTWVEGSLAGDSPTIAELTSASHWTRVFERKLIPMAFLIHN